MRIRLQTQIVNYVLLSSVVLGIALGVYLWAGPIIEKNQARNTINNLEIALSELAKEIENVALLETISSYSINFNGRVEVKENKIILAIETPIEYYTTIIDRIPINYVDVGGCYVNNTVSKNDDIFVELCGDSSLLVKANYTTIFINDTMNNKTLSLPIGNYKDIIIKNYVFDIINRIDDVVFIWKSGLGYGESPICIIDARSYKSGNTIVIEYTLSCRPVLDLRTHKCLWIKIVPSGTVGKISTGETIFRISYNSKRIVIPNSTVCSYLEEKLVGVSVI